MGLPYGQCCTSKFLLKKFLLPNYLKKFDHQGKNIINLYGIYPKKPYMLGTGPLIPIPLKRERKWLWNLEDYTGIGAEDDIDMDNDEENTSDCSQERLADKENRKFINGSSSLDYLLETKSEPHKESPPEPVNMSEFDKLEEEESMDSDSSQEEITRGATPPGLEDGRQPTVDELEEFVLGTQEDK
ncbi:hypothetical protein ACLOJK_008834 [Asimina triloba]